MFWNILFGVLTAAFAVFGLICALRAVVNWCFPLEQIGVVVQILCLEDADGLELLLREAKFSSFCGRVCPVVLIAEELTENGEIPERITEILERYGAECYLI